MNSDILIMRLGRVVEAIHDDDKVFAINALIAIIKEIEKEQPNQGRKN